MKPDLWSLPPRPITHKFKRRWVELDGVRTKILLCACGAWMLAPATKVKASKETVH